MTTIPIEMLPKYDDEFDPKICAEELLLQASVFRSAHDHEEGGCQAALLPEYLEQSAHLLQYAWGWLFSLRGNHFSQRAYAIGRIGGVLVYLKTSEIEAIRLDSLGGDYSAIAEQLLEIEKHGH